MWFEYLRNLAIGFLVALLGLGLVWLAPPAYGDVHAVSALGWFGIAVHGVGMVLIVAAYVQSTRRINRGR